MKLIRRMFFCPLGEHRYYGVPYRALTSDGRAGGAAFYVIARDCEICHHHESVFESFCDGVPRKLGPL